MRGTAVLSSPDARHRQTGSCHPTDRRHLITSAAASRAPPALLALFALAPDSAVRAHALAAAVAAYASDSVVLADARAPAVLAGAPAAVMRADARAPAVLAVWAPHAIAGQGTCQSFCQICQRFAN